MAAVPELQHLIEEMDQMDEVENGQVEVVPAAEWDIFDVLADTIGPNPPPSSASLCAPAVPAWRGVITRPQPAVSGGHDRSRGQDAPRTELVQEFDRILEEIKWGELFSTLDLDIIDPTNPPPSSAPRPHPPVSPWKQVVTQPLSVATGECGGTVLQDAAIMEITREFERVIEGLEWADVVSTLEMALHDVLANTSNPPPASALPHPVPTWQEAKSRSQAAASGGYGGFVPQGAAPHMMAAPTTYTGAQCQEDGMFPGPLCGQALYNQAQVRH